MNKQTATIVVIGVTVLLMIIFGSRMFKILQPGERGVQFKPYTKGLVYDKIYMPGFHIIAPWNQLYIFDVKEQKVDETMDILDKNSLSIEVDVSVRFYPAEQRIGYLYERFGAKNNYINQLVVPEVRSSVRSIMGRYTAEEIFSTKRTEVEEAIFKETRDILRNERNNVEMTALLIRSIKLPTQIKDAIENKLKQEQEALAYKFKLEKERSEADRKRIEAEGIAAFNRIVNSSLTNNILTQRGIEATLELAKSQNSKVVVVGSGKDGLPLILGNN